ncbi:MULTISPECIES: xylulokinase [unclassified Exiguobacterium]|uniref:xylulokinase n=1 Tax=unclassified Exiguobacterium TaxID=2644629 RepID=UPI001BE5A059|nr:MULTISPECIES: xylulokinase [unclassified Exiguobacterium]
MKYVIGIDLGTSAVKAILVDQNGQICGEASRAYPLIQEREGYSEQDPSAWVEQTVNALTELVQKFEGRPEDIEGISFSGQMHGLVLLDAQHQLLRNAILWNDTRTTAECEEIKDRLGPLLLDLTKNPALEGFTLPKLLWVKRYEPDLFRQAAVFLLPKDYVRYALTGQLHMDYSDAAGTLLLDIAKKEWSDEICERVGVPKSLCPPLVESSDQIGTLSSYYATRTGLSSNVNVFAGGADNACGAIGAGILNDQQTMCSIGTSGVVLAYEPTALLDFKGKVHYFNHAKPGAYYTMGVTLAAGHSLSWFKDTFAPDQSFETLLAEVKDVPIGANGLLFTPYLVGERTPHADAMVRGSFIGMDSTHRLADFSRAVLEGITFSLKESLELFRAEGKVITSIVSIGGGAKNEAWLQMQADIFDATIIKLSNEQGCALGAAMLAAYGCGWFNSLEACSKAFIQEAKRYEPIPENVTRYHALFALYQQVYPATKQLSHGLSAFRRK